MPEDESARPTGFTTRKPEWTSAGRFLIDPDGVIQAMEVLTPPVGRNIAEMIRQVKAFQHVRATGEATPSGWQPGKADLETGPRPGRKSLDGLETGDGVLISANSVFGSRIIESAHKKVAEALVKGKALKIEGGEFEMSSMSKFRCYDCQHSWELPYGTGRPEGCPSCKSGNIRRAEEDRGYGRRGGEGQGRCCRGTQQKQ